MKQSNKNRQNGRHTNNRFGNNRHQSNNAVTRNTAFDSTSVAGRMRGTAQQLIDKYLSLAKDAKTQDDRILHETYLQYADHYTRMLELAIQNEQARIAQAAQQQAQRIAATQVSVPFEPQIEQTQNTDSESVILEENVDVEMKKSKQCKNKMKKASHNNDQKLEKVNDALSLPISEELPLEQEDSDVNETDVVPQPVVIEIPE